MKCPHCGVVVHEGWSVLDIYCPGIITDYKYKTMLCPECGDLIILFVPPIGEDFFIEPRFPTRSPVPNEVPAAISSDYVEACNVLGISPKASAALSRRCLQNVLRSNGYQQHDLAKQIDAALSETDASKSLPNACRDVLDAIRGFGNFSAHPINDLTTTQIIDVEPHEAEWCLDILEELFDHYYVRPSRALAKKAALNAKLAAAGKPPAK